MFSKQIIILKKKYFHQHWNTLEFFIVLIGIVDVFCIYFVRLRPDNLILIQFTVIIGAFRIIRFFPLLKVKFHINFFFSILFVNWIKKTHCFRRNEGGSYLFSWNPLSTDICLVHPLTPSSHCSTLTFSWRRPSLTMLCKMATCPPYSQLSTPSPWSLFICLIFYA